MRSHEELSLLIESIEDDLARAARSGNVAASRQFAQELRARFSIYRDACADAGIAWAVRSQRAKKAHAPVTDGNPATMREAIIEVEQAADSAKVAAEADGGVREETRQAVLDAHLTICLLKAKM